MRSRRSPLGPPSSFAPTLIGTIYGMNFTNIPELDWRFGYPMALMLMVITSATLWMIFRQPWLVDLMPCSMIAWADKLESRH